MVSYKPLVWFLAIVPTAGIFALVRLSPHLLSGSKDIDASFILSLTGTMLSYYGVIFSAYAALQVQAISDVYFFRMRSPDLRKKLSQISKLVSEFGTEPSDDLRSQRFLSEATVAFRAAKRVKNKHVKMVAEQAETSLRTLRDSMKIACGPGISAGQIPNYWDFHQKIAELLDEVGEQQKDARAHS